MNHQYLLLPVLALSLLSACSRDEPEAVVDTPAASTTQAPSPVQITDPVHMEYEEPIVGGARMVAGDNILSNLAKSSEHTILMSAIDAAGLTGILQGNGPFTLFAPTDAAFRAIPGGYDDLMKVENRQRLISVLSYHLVPERLDADVLARRVMDGNGSAQLTTVEGGMLKVTVGDGAAILVDSKGSFSKMTTPNVLQSNGVVQVIDSVLMP